LTTRVCFALYSFALSFSLIVNKIYTHSPLLHFFLASVTIALPLPLIRRRRR